MYYLSIGLDWCCFSEYVKALVDPQELKEKIGWATSNAFEIDVVAVSDKKAHVVIRNIRRQRSDVSLIEGATAFYAFKNTNNDWKIYALSDITFPALS